MQEPIVALRFGALAADASFQRHELAQSILASHDVHRPAQLVLASPTAVPPVPLLACLGILVAALPAVLAPPPPPVRAEPAAEAARPEEVAA